ncbi:hypothetical protein ACM615_02750 [Rahnella sp. PAMC25617]|uniref:hypothetical protein n=1 Tax=Rahnella sp. PAMC25617 TaxID=3399684 RepID=UPI003D369680
MQPFTLLDQMGMFRLLIGTMARYWRFLKTDRGGMFRFLNNCAHIGYFAETEQKGKAFPLCTPLAFSLRAVAGMKDMFRHIGVWRKMSSLRDALISGFEPLVSNHSFGAIFEHANQLI